MTFKRNTEKYISICRWAICCFEELNFPVRNLNKFINLRLPLSSRNLFQNLWTLLWSSIMEHRKMFVNEQYWHHRQIKLGFRINIPEPRNIEHILHHTLDSRTHLMPSQRKKYSISLGIIKSTMITYQVTQCELIFC